MILKINKKKKKTFILILCGLLFFQCKEKKNLDIVYAGKAPDFRLEDINHKRFYLNQHKDKNIILVFWATWCVICKKYLNELEKLKSEFKDKNTEIVSILTDPENIDVLNEILKTSVHISYPVLLDRKQIVMKKFGAKKMPTTILIGKENQIVMKRTGYNISTIEQINSKLNLVLENSN